MVKNNEESIQMWRAAARKAVPCGAALVVAMLSLLLPGTIKASKAQSTPRMTSETTGTPNAVEMQAWHKAIMKVPPPKAGCYTAKFPDTGWTPRPCKTPPHKLYMPRSAGRALTPQVGGQSGADFVATWNGNPTESEGGRSTAWRP
jgi:hypothetical protein